MAFDAFQLNGLDLSDGTFARAVYIADEVDGDFPISVSRNDPVSNPGKITVINSDYIAGHDFIVTAEYNGHTYESSYGYALPVFGEIQFEGNSITYYINGFTQNGLLLSPYKEISKGAGGNGNDGSRPGFISNSYILSSYDLYSPSGVSFPAEFTNDYTAYEVPPVCFAEGTRITTARGPVAVEELTEGDLVLTAAGEARRVKWIGHMVARPSRHPRPHEVKPVRVKAHAFGRNLPERDVRLSPGHAVYVDGVLVPVGQLVNDATIVQEDVEQVRYFHVELDSHDVLLAEGLPCESYLDDGNRATFVNSSEFTELHGRLDPKSWAYACAPMVAAGPQLAEIRQRLHAQAEALGWVKSETADLLIEADGAAVMPLRRSGNRYWFAVPAAERLVLRSNSGVLAHVMPGLTDARKLGVAVGELRVDGRVLPLQDAAFGAGFYPAERHEQHAWRWTNGAADLKPTLAHPVMIEVSLLMVAPSWLRAAPQLRVVA